MTDARSWKGLLACAWHSGGQQGEEGCMLACMRRAEATQAGGGVGGLLLLAAHNTVRRCRLYGWKIVIQNVMTMRRRGRWATG